MAFALPSHLSPSAVEYAVAASASSSTDGHLDQLLAPLTSQPWSKITASSVRSHRNVVQKDVLKTEAELFKLVTSQYGMVRDQVNGGLDVKAKSDALERGLEKTQAGFDRDHTSLLPPLLKTLTEHASTLASHSRTASSLDLLTFLRSAHTTFEDLRIAPDFPTAVKRWMACSQLMDRDEWTWAGGGPETVKIKALRDEGLSKLRKHGDRLREELSGIWEASVRVDWTDVEKLGVLTIRDPQQISWQELCSSLSSLSAMDPLLASLTSHILSRAIEPILSLPAESASSSASCPACFFCSDSSDGALSIFRFSLASTGPSSTGWTEVASPLDLLNALLDFIHANSNRLPPLPALVPSIAPLVQSLHLSPALPRLRPAILPEFARACQGFSETLEGGRSGELGVWVEGLVGRWVRCRRGEIMGSIRSIVAQEKGWDGWVWETERAVEPSVVEPAAPTLALTPGKHATDDDDGWGHSSSPLVEPHPLPASTTSFPEPTAEDDDDAWGFSPSPPKSPALPATNVASSVISPSAILSDDDDDGWNLSDDEAPAPAPVAPTSPAPAPRQARGLAKLAAKSRPKDASSPSPSHSPSPSLSRSSFSERPSSPSTENLDAQQPKLVKGGMRLGKRPPSGHAAATSSAELESEDDARGEPAPAATGPYVVQEKRLVSIRVKEVLEVLTTIQEESAALDSLALPSSSASALRLSRAAPDVLSLFRALVPVAHKRTLSQVPALSMQLVNDCTWLAGEIELLSASSPNAGISSTDAERTRSLGDRTFEGEIATQVAALMETLDEATRFTDTASDKGFKETELAVKRAVYKVELLAKVWKPVLATEQLYVALGKMVSALLDRMLAELLALPDITSRESERLNVVCKMVHPLENVFKASDDPDSPSAVVAYVPPWLKFCYLSELLEASMADITYLFNSGALIDFSVDELASLLRALFSDTPLRASTIDKVMQGHPTL